MTESLAAADDCMICFDKPLLYGLLQNCNHQFCLDCIKTWRKSGPVSNSHNEEVARSTTACPLCRQPSKIVFPSTTLPATVFDKDKILQGVYAQKKRTLCRHFEASIATIEGYYCPDFNDCLYAHLEPSDSIRKEFKFTEDRIRQLRLRKAIDAQEAGDSFTALMPPHVSEALSEALQSASVIGDIGLEDDELIMSEIVGEFLTAYQRHARTLQIWFEGHLHTETKDEHHIYHLYNTDGECMDYPEENEGYPLSGPVYHDFEDPYIQQHPVLGKITHFFMSPLDVEEAIYTIVHEPSYHALRAAIISQEQLPEYDTVDAYAESLRWDHIDMQSDHSWVDEEEEDADGEDEGDEDLPELIAID